jgi:quinol monooxygenase YgiN
MDQKGEDQMIHVIASIHIKEGHKSEFIDIFKANIPLVLEEKGCIEYVPTVDVPTGLAAQELSADVVTIVEKWDNLEALRAHMAAPHMQAYHKKVKDIVEKVTLKILARA